MRAALVRVFGNGRYLLLCLAVFWLGLSLIVFLPNWSLIGEIITSDALSFSAKVLFVGTFYGSISTNFTAFSAAYTLTLLLLFAVNTTLFLYYIRRAQRLTTGVNTAHTSSAAGMLAGLLGIGCAACGSVILTGLVTSLGVSGLLLYLPLRGGELALLGILFLGWSIRYLLQKISDPLVCRVDT